MSENVVISWSKTFLALVNCVHDLLRSAEQTPHALHVVYGNVFVPPYFHMYVGLNAMPIVLIACVHDTMCNHSNLQVTMCNHSNLQVNIASASD